MDVRCILLRSQWPRPSEPVFPLLNLQATWSWILVGETTDIAIISLGGIVYSQSVKIAGDQIDAAIMKPY